MKTGIMGGTFDPIHLGHLFLAEEAMQTFCLDRIVFVPSKLGPHKLNITSTPAQIRLKMVEAAIADHPCFEVSDIEIRRSGISYTVDTIDAFKAMWPSDDFYFITGADAIVQIETWKSFKKLLEEVNFVAATRPSVDLDTYNAEIKRLDETYGARIHKVPMLNLEISSSDIRWRVQSGRSIRYLVPDAVKGVIENHGLYK